ncbi:MAG: uncharacterized protein A8A55_0261 [Amphiamblys sp. WSBS2006]|nr:MAG: uncharacterized protein A8A55_0261 [Amphiamblys sp. WSBS2006]
MKRRYQPKSLLEWTKKKCPRNRTDSPSFPIDKALLRRLASNTETVATASREEHTQPVTLDGVGELGSSGLTASHDGNILGLFYGRCISSLCWARTDGETKTHFFCVSSVREYGEDLAGTAQTEGRITVYETGENRRADIEHAFGDCREIHAEHHGHALVFFCQFADGTVRVFSVKANSETLLLKKPAVTISNAPVVCFAVHRNPQRTLLTCHIDGTAQIHNPATRKNTSFVLDGADNLPVSCTPYKDGCFLLAMRNEKIDLLCPSGKREAAYRLNKTIFYRIQWSSTQDRVFFGENKDVFTMDTDKRKRVVYSAHTLLSEFALSENYPLCVAGYIDGTFAVVMARDNKRRFSREYTLSGAGGRFSLEKKNRKTPPWLDVTNAVTAVGWNTACDYPAVGFANGIVLVLKRTYRTF